MILLVITLCDSQYIFFCTTFLINQLINILSFFVSLFRMMIDFNHSTVQNLLTRQFVNRSILNLIFDSLKILGVFSEMFFSSIKVKNAFDKNLFNSISQMRYHLVNFLYSCLCLYSISFSPFVCVYNLSLSLFFFHLPLTHSICISFFCSLSHLLCHSISFPLNFFFLPFLFVKVFSLSVSLSALCLFIFFCLFCLFFLILFFLFISSSLSFFLSVH
jgi:hypothetical protein